MALRRRRNRRDGPARAAEAHPVDELLPVGPMVVYGLQHVLSMYAGVVAVPLIVGTVAASGIRTLSRVDYEGNAILLNLLFNFRRGAVEEGPIFAEAPPIGTTFEGDTEGPGDRGRPPAPDPPPPPPPGTRRPLGETGVRAAL